MFVAPAMGKNQFFEGSRAVEHSAFFSSGDNREEIFQPYSSKLITESKYHHLSTD
jgi:hypothetical protein